METNSSIIKEENAAPMHSSTPKNVVDSSKLALLKRKARKSRNAPSHEALLKKDISNVPGLKSFAAEKEAMDGAVSSSRTRKEPRVRPVPRHSAGGQGGRRSSRPLEITQPKQQQSSSALGGGGESKDIARQGADSYPPGLDEVLEGKVQAPIPHDEIKVGPTHCSSRQGEEKELTDEELRILREMMARPKTKIVWECKECSKECIPVRSESRCICGHRYKDHPVEWKPKPGRKNANQQKPASFKPFQCQNCPCPYFFYIVAEGAWILRCRCKHKHTDHDPIARGKYPCKKPKCNCQGFDSPWVCNCNHPWGSHEQRIVKEGFQDGSIPLLADQSNFSDLSNVQRTDLKANPLHLK